jgi:hypothetical protein
MSGKSFLRLDASVASFGPSAEDDTILHVALFCCCGLLITLLVAAAMPDWIEAMALVRLE